MIYRFECTVYCEFYFNVRNFHDNTVLCLFKLMPDYIWSYNTTMTFLLIQVHGYVNLPKLQLLKFIHSKIFISTVHRIQLMDCQPHPQYSNKDLHAWTTHEGMADNTSITYLETLTIWRMYIILELMTKTALIYLKQLFFLSLSHHLL